MNSNASNVILFFIIFPMFFFGCKTSEKQSSATTSVLPIATMNFQDTITTIKLNADKTMKLVIKEVRKQGDPAAHFTYSVFNITDQTLLKQGTFRGELVTWNDKNSLKLIPYVGIEQKPSSDNPEDFLKSKNKNQTDIIIIKLDTL